MVVQAHGRHVFRHVLDQAQLVVLATGGEDIDDLGARGHLLDHVVLGGNQLGHTLFDRRHVLRGERALGEDVVVETFVDHRADDHLHIRIQLLDRMTDQVGAGVADDFHALLVLGGDDAQTGITADQVAGINQLAIHFTGDGGLGQAGADGLGHVHDADRVVELAGTAVGKGNGDHEFIVYSERQGRIEPEMPVIRAKKKRHEGACNGCNLGWRQRQEMVVAMSHTRPAHWRGPPEGWFEGASFNHKHHALATARAPRRSHRTRHGQSQHGSGGGGRQEPAHVQRTTRMPDSGQRKKQAR